MTEGQGVAATSAPWDGPGEAAPVPAPQQTSGGPVAGGPAAGGPVAGADRGHAAGRPGAHARGGTGGQSAMPGRGPAIPGRPSATPSRSAAAPGRGSATPGRGPAAPGRGAVAGRGDAAEPHVRVDAHKLEIGRAHV